MSGSHFEGNKIVAAVLVALLLGHSASLIADHLVAPKPLEKHAYAPVDIAAAPTADEGDVKEAAIEPISPLLKLASVENGQVVAKKCTACHSLVKDGPNLVGPKMWGVVGGHQRHIADFAYSKAFQGLSGEWNYEELNKFLIKPAKYAPGTKMSFAGIKSPQERADLIVYLRTLSDSPPALPTE
jgi:cytochrome c